MSYLLDTNMLIYHLNGQLPASAEKWLQTAIINQSKISIISVIEVLGCSKMTVSLEKNSSVFTSI